MRTIQSSIASFVLWSCLAIAFAALVGGCGTDGSSVEPEDDGVNRVPWCGDLDVGGELDKLVCPHYTNVGTCKFYSAKNDRIETVTERCYFYPTQTMFWTCVPSCDKI